MDEHKITPIYTVSQFKVKCNLGKLNMYGSVQSGDILCFNSVNLPEITSSLTCDMQDEGFMKNDERQGYNWLSCCSKEKQG